MQRSEVAMTLFQIGPYDVIAELARDALGTTYLCRRDGDPGPSAITHIDERHVREPELARALDSARAALALAHPHLISAELGEFEWGAYLATAYLEAGSLADLLARSRSHACRPGVLVRILLDALTGLAAAHAEGHVHRHLSPERIVVGSDGVARVAELGLAEARGIAEPELSPYTAPRARGDRADARSDVFALGAIAWSALTGHALFAGHDDAGTRQRLLQLDVPPPSTVGARPPAAFDTVVLRALARDPADRFQTATAMLDALRDAATDVAARDEVAHWVDRSFVEQFAVRRAVLSDPVGDPSELAVCPPLRGRAAATRRRAPSDGRARSVAMLGAAFAAGAVAAHVLF